MWKFGFVLYLFSFIFDRVQYDKTIQTNLRHVSLTTPRKSVFQESCKFKISALRKVISFVQTRSPSFFVSISVSVVFALQHLTFCFVCHAVIEFNSFWQVLMLLSSSGATVDFGLSCRLSFAIFVLVCSLASFWLSLLLRLVLMTKINRYERERCSSRLSVAKMSTKQSYFYPSLLLSFRSLKS